MKRVKLFFLIGIVCLITVPSLAQPAKIGVFDGQADIGAVQKPGSARYDSRTHVYELSGPVTKNSTGSDGGHYLWKRMKGDFILYTRVVSSKQLPNASPRIGWTVRRGLDSRSPEVSLIRSGDGRTELQFRRNPDAQLEEIRAQVSGVDVLQLERKGNTYTMRVAKFGDPFTTKQVTDLALGEEVYVGLFAGSSEGNGQERIGFRDVRISTPMQEGQVAYRDYLASNLEILDVTTGNRQVVFNAPKSIQAPNWTPDGKTLIYNGDGLIYKFDLAKGQPVVFNTGSVSNNNNDHVLSFDGKQVGLSSGLKELGGSIIYTVPITGGEPKQITPKGPSYLHGWSPDAKTLVFTGSRNNEFDIYSVPSSGGSEVRLTDAKGLDDGPEYTPDGTYIYFNSDRTGTMQIWRMKPDGSQQEAVTKGDFHDWFPHVSPDGKWIIFLSFLKEEVQSGDHPFYKHVYLRMLPTSGVGTPKVVAYLYGGQGTINTPSWSPDSKRVAFISNTAESTMSPVEK